MMWDDHDVFDGWGSWPPARQNCPVFRGVAAAARDAFALFQLAAQPDDLPEGFADRQGGHFGCAWESGIHRPSRPRFALGTKGRPK